MVSYLSSDKITTGGAQRGGESSVKFRARILQGYNLFLKVIEGNEELLGSLINFSKCGAPSRCDGIATGAGLRGMFDKNGYRSLDRVLPFVAACIDRSTDYKKAEHMTAVRTRYREIFGDLTGDKNQ